MTCSVKGVLPLVGEWAHQTICLRKEHWLGGCQGVVPRKIGIALAEVLSDLGGGRSFWLNASMIGDSRAVPLLNCTLVFAL
jgi:hypothetical protein